MSYGSEMNHIIVNIIEANIMGCWPLGNMEGYSLIPINYARKQTTSMFQIRDLVRISSPPIYQVISIPLNSP